MEGGEVTGKARKRGKGRKVRRAHGPGRVRSRAMCLCTVEIFDIVLSVGAASHGNLTR